ncbi:MAG: hypothetical protein HFG17_03375 [Oscillospiraceae bacterium]|nr:hypothetical protein [Oscillospiraceae bacterium]MCI9668390.1 hypothetical protein [Oscillospiraceae bacterium]
MGLLLKGVSQKVIEVVRTDNKYFEKAILFLRPNAPEEDKNKLKSHAWDYLGQIEYHPPARGKGRFWFDVMRLSLAALAGAAVTAVFFLL